jgi:hypothetical protein
MELEELLEDALLLALGDAEAAICDTDRDTTTSDGRASESDRQTRSELERVAREVEQDLPHPSRVGEGTSGKVIITPG